MATTIARLQAILGADTRQFDKAMDRSHKNLSGVSKAAGIAGAALGGALALGAVAGFKELMQGQKVAAQTNAVLKSTGSQAHVTAKGIDSLATALMRKSGVDDEAIKSSENLLLTFRGIRNETGKGNKIFDQATKATLDLSVAFHKDLNSSAILVGKALQDPVKGMSALRRVGVQLDSAQQQLIKDLVEGRKAIDTISLGFDNLSPKQTEQATKLAKLNFSWQEIADKLNLQYSPAQKKAFDFMEAGGHTIQAQKIILGELRKETEGSAAAFGKTLPGQMAIARESFKNLAAEIVGAVLPAVTQLVSAMARAVDWLTEHKKTTDLLVKALITLTATLFAVSAAHKIHTAALAVATTAMKLYEIWVLRAEYAQYGLNVAIRANPYIAAATAIAALIAALVILQMKYNAVTNAIKYVYNHEYILMAVPLIGWGLALGVALYKVRGAFISVGEAISNSVLVAVRALDTALQKVIDAFKWLIDHAKSIGGIFGKIRGAIGGAVGAVGDVASGANSTIAAAKRPGYAVAGLQPETQGFLNLINKLYDDFVVTSGRRSPGENHRVGGAPMSDHLTGRAFDLVPKDGWNDHSIALFDKIAAYAAISPIVRWIGWRGVPGHGPGNHLHISTFDQGGWLKPGLTLAQNNTGRPEMVGGGNITIPVSIGGEHVATVVFDMLRRKARVFENRNGRLAFGG